jgi:uncharacterized protein (UPF0218 family)
MDIPEKTRKELKRPLGELHLDFRRIRELSSGKKVISIGDVCTLGLLAMGIRPHLAVFDHKYMRHELAPEFTRILDSNYPEPVRISNPAGTLSEEILENAEKLMETGGAVLIDGEEDLTALAFIKNATDDYVIVYGQPNEGMVVVIPDNKIKKKIEKWLASSMPLGHEV